jgi:hypothetical protein|tara:strand:- start:274 stop:573 length:300 start_codon:yes stop_codon:yes gene_type:complete
VEAVALETFLQIMMVGLAVAAVVALDPVVTVVLEILHHQPHHHILLYKDILVVVVAIPAATLVAVAVDLDKLVVIIMEEMDNSILSLLGLYLISCLLDG